jgi:hypothetical protein
MSVGEQEDGDDRCHTEPGVASERLGGGKVRSLLHFGGERCGFIALLR